ncbi:amidohydrolase family protein [Stomatohabitans albus]|uniref:amidohydrolase family protein n=1 Tax=Stomatohabitans albus TaxID=3110766 RepID=UPI00300CBEA2
MSTIHLRGPILRGPDDVVGQGWVVDGRMTYTKPSGSIDHTIDGWVIPGLVDAHCHIGLGAKGPVSDDEALAHGQRDLSAGVTLVRDAGAPSDTNWLRDDLRVPEIIRAGKHIARTRRYFRDFAVEVEPEYLAAEATRQAKAGDGWIKLVADWIDRETGDLGQTFTPEQFNAAIEAAHQAGARVTAHAFDEGSIEPLVLGGIDGIEHATGMTETTVGLVADHQVAVVPTLININTFESIVASAREKFPTYARHMQALYDRRYQTIHMAHEAGVPLFAGTDAGSAITHGRIGEELVELTKAGLSHTEALAAGCWHARKWLGYAGLEEGEWADAMVVPQDPREQVVVCQHPRAVLRRGRSVGLV